MKLNKKERWEVKHFIESFVAGSAFFWAGYLAFPIFREILGWSVWWANTASYLIGWTINYFLQRYWVFNNPRLKKHEVETTKRYTILSAVNLVIDNLIIVGLNSIGITPYIGKFFSAGFFTFWNYIWYRLWVFPQKFTSQNRKKSKKSPAKPKKRK